MFLVAYKLKQILFTLLLKFDAAYLIFMEQIVLFLNWKLIAGHKICFAEEYRCIEINYSLPKKDRISSKDSVINAYV